MIVWQNRRGEEETESSGSEEDSVVVWVENVQGAAGVCAGHWVQPGSRGLKCQSEEFGGSLVRNFQVPLH